MSTTTPHATLERAQAKVAEARCRAAAVRATLSPELLEFLAAQAAGIPELLSRTFVSPDNGHGRQSFYFATAAELAEWSAR